MYHAEGQQTHANKNVDIDRDSPPPQDFLMCTVHMHYVHKSKSWSLATFAQGTARQTIRHLCTKGTACQNSAQKAQRVRSRARAGKHQLCAVSCIRDHLHVFAIETGGQ